MIEGVLEGVLGLGCYCCCLLTKHEIRDFVSPLVFPALFPPFSIFSILIVLIFLGRTLSRVISKPNTHS